MTCYPPAFDEERAEMVQECVENRGHTDFLWEAANDLFGLD